MTTDRLAFVLEDEPEMRRELCCILTQGFPELRVHAAADIATARTMLAALHRDGAALSLALIDLGLPDGSGLDVIRLVAAGWPEATVIVTTIYDDDGHLFDAIAAGAGGYLLKDGEAGSLLHFLGRIRAGEPPLSPSIARRIMRHFAATGSETAPSAPPEDLPALTPREAEVLTLLGRGLRISDVAGLLGLSAHTVSSHVKSIYQKLNISNRAEAAVEAMRRNLL